MSFSHASKSRSHLNHRQPCPGQATRLEQRRQVRLHHRHCLGRGAFALNCLSQAQRVTNRRLTHVIARCCNVFFACGTCMMFWPCWPSECVPIPRATSHGPLPQGSTWTLQLQILETDRNIIYPLSRVQQRLDQRKLLQVDADLLILCQSCVSDNVSGPL